MPQKSLLTPFGTMTISEDDGAIVSLDWGEGRDQDQTPLLQEAAQQLQAYFDGTLDTFDLPLDPPVSDFQKRVLDAISAIPKGGTRTYGEIASELGSHARAVGTACGANPIPIIIPCHRVMAANGKLTGYSGEGGVDTKRRLLEFEGALLPLT